MKVEWHGAALSAAVKVVGLASIHRESEGVLTRTIPRTPIDRGPLREPSLTPEEILMSESQERMMAVVRPEDLDAFLAIEYSDGAIEHAKRALNLDREVNVTRGVNDVDFDQFAELYTGIISAVPELKKTKSYSILHAGAADDGISAMVVLELNNKIICSTFKSGKHIPGIKELGYQNYRDVPGLWISL